MSTSTATKQDQIIDIVRTKGTCTSTAIAAALDVKTNTITATLTRMVKAGLLESFDGDGKRGYQVPVSEETPEAVAAETQTLVPVLRAALAVSAERINEGTKLEVTTSGYAKTSTVKVDDTTAYVTIDGAWIVSKDGEDHKQPWTLYRTGVETVTPVGTFKSSSAALAAENLD